MMISDPVLAGSGREKHEQVFSSGTPGAEPKRTRQLVLLVEDDPNDLRMYGMALWYNGFDVLEAADGESGVSLAREHHPDLVLVDLLLPKLTGIEVCRRIRKSGLDVPVIALTARAQREFGDVAREAGCMDYLEKPISPLQLLHVVEHVIGRAPPSGEDAEPRRSRPLA
jgi:DNA-binding response OmpR family regulator